MGYGTNEKAELKQDTKYFQSGGIHNNVKLQSVKFVNSKQDGSGDKQVIDFLIIGENGELFNHREWPQEEDGKIKNQSIRLRRWVKELTGSDSFPTTFASWADCAHIFINFILGSNTLLQVKLLYNDKGFLEMPKYDSAVRSMADATLTISKAEEAKTRKRSATPTDIDSIVDDLPGDTSDNLPF